MTSASPPTTTPSSTQRVILVCDESGAKGYADKDESRPGEVGVFAGLMVPGELIAEATSTLEAAAAPHRLADGKLHITGLDPAAQGHLRDRIFEAIRELKLPCFWYAIHVAGFHYHHLNMEALLAQTRQDIAAHNPNRRIKTSGSKRRPELLHNALFQGLYMHLVAFMEERFGGPVEIEVRTDRVDAPTAKLFAEEAARLLDNSPRVHKVTGFDTVEQKVVEGSITGTTDWPDSLAINTEVKTLDIIPTGDDDPLVVAADVLANSLAHLFHHRGPNQLYGDLNRPAAIADHPLHESLDAFWNWGEGDDVSDRLYRHPKAPPLP